MFSVFKFAPSIDNKTLVHLTKKMIKFHETEADKLFETIEKLLFKDESIKRKYEAMLTIPAIGTQPLCTKSA